MNLTVHQNIVIQQLHIHTLSQSSVLQIGTAGKISGLSRAFTFTGYVPGMFVPPGPEPEAESVVPLPSITA